MPKGDKTLIKRYNFTDKELNEQIIKICENVVVMSKNKTTDGNIRTEESVLLLDGGSNTVTQTLPLAKKVRGKIFYLKAIDVSNTVTVSCNTGDTIGGSSTYVFSNANESIIVASDGISDWKLILADTNIDHDALLNFVANEHIDWTNASQNLKTSGKVGIGINDTQQASLHIKASTIAAQSAPLKFNQGSLMSTPEAGAFEFAGSGDKLYFTITTGPTRKEVAFTDAYGMVPIGSIIAWTDNITGTPALPSSFKLCDGSTISDSESPMNGQTLPDLNGDERFLRGSGTSGTTQADAFQGHRHTVINNYVPLRSDGAGGNTHTAGTATAVVNASDFVGDPRTDGTNGTPRTASETRPINMSVKWVMRIK